MRIFIVCTVPQILLMLLNPGWGGNDIKNGRDEKFTKTSNINPEAKGPI